MQLVRCDGWWEQQGLGRQLMTNLQLGFRDGEIIGQGEDVIGEFVLSGRLKDGQTTLLKQYIGAHQVNYPGSFDGEGTLQGLWSINEIGGRWLIKIVGSATAANPIEIIEPSA